MCWKYSRDTLIRDSNADVEILEGGNETTELDASRGAEAFCDGISQTLSTMTTRMCIPFCDSDGSI